MLTYRKKRKKRIKDSQLAGPVSLLLGAFVWPLLVSVVAVLLPLAAGQDLPGVVSTSSYPSGELCGSLPQRRCLSEASCTQFGQCQCPADTSGDGSFHCYPTNTIQAQLQGSSQQLRTFRNTSVVIGWPCRFRFTEFTTMRNDSQQMCLFQIFAVNQIVGGRIATTGFEVHLQVTLGSETVGGIGIRKDGKATDGVFTYTERGRNQFINELPIIDDDINDDDSMTDGSGSGEENLIEEEESDIYDWGPPEELIVDGQRVVCEVDKDNFATVDASSCGTTVRFRAPDLDAVNESQTPGLTVSISQKQGPVLFKSPRTNLAESDTRGTMSQRAQKKNITVEQEALHRSMVFAARQRRTPEGTECEDTARIYRSYCGEASQKIAALKSCSFFLENPDFISCMDPPSGAASSNSLNAFKLCLWNSCRPSSSVCNLMKSRIHQRGCTSQLPAEFSPLTCGV